MSVSLFVCYRDPRKEDRLIPIASEEVFVNHWKPVCAELQLRWIPQFHHGWMLSFQDMTYILEELARLRRYLTCGETHAEIRHQMLARISILARELHQLNVTMDADAFIGCVRRSQRRLFPSVARPEGNALSVGAWPPVLVGMTPQTPSSRPVDPLPGTTASAATSPGTLTDA